MPADKFNGIVVLLFFALFYSFFGIGHFGGDGYADYLTAESIVLDRNISLYDRPQDTDELKYPEKPGKAGRDGKIYSARGALGLPVVLTLFYFLGHVASIALKGIPHDFITMFFVSFANPFILALDCYLIFIIAKQLGFLPKTAIILPFIFGLATMAPVYARTAFSEPALILFLLLAFQSLLRYKEHHKTRYLIFSATALAYSVLIRPSALIFIPCFIIYLFLVIHTMASSGSARIREFCIYLSALAIPLVILAVFNHSVFGNFLQFGGQEAIATGKRILGAEHTLKGVYYYLFSTGKGFFLFNLPLIFAFIGFYKAPKERKREAVLFMLIFAVNLLFFVKSFRRGSLFSWGPRYLLPSAAFLVFLLGDFYEQKKNLFSRLALAGSCVAGFLLILPCMFVNQSKFYFFVKERLGLDEYLINFIPDLSPILGAWRMFLSNLQLKFFNINPVFIYNPDYRLVQPVGGSLYPYNQPDSWLTKVISFAPAYKPLALVAAALIASGIIYYLFIVIRGYKTCCRK